MGLEWFHCTFLTFLPLQPVSSFSISAMHLYRLLNFCSEVISFSASFTLGSESQDATGDIEALVGVHASNTDRGTAAIELSSSVLEKCDGPVPLIFGQLGVEPLESVPRLFQDDTCTKACRFCQSLGYVFS